jgi:nucleotide-binding universal stress UspA family protein
MGANKIVVGIDGFGGSRLAVDWAAAECRLRDAELVMLHALDSMDSRLAALAPAGSAHSADGFAQLVIAEEFAEANWRHPDIVIRRMFSHAPPAEALIDATNDAALLVLGTNGVADVTDSILGSVGHRVAVRAHCPVAIVAANRLRPSAHSGHVVVVGMARGRAGRLAMRWAMEESLRRGARLVGVVAGKHFPPGAMEELAAEVSHREPSLNFEIRQSGATAADAIIAEAGGADLIVLGCHHSEEQWPTRLGAVPDAVLPRAGCPVVLTGQQAYG